MTTDTLRTVPLFESLSDEEATILCQYLETKDCKPQHVLFRGGDAGDGMYLIEEGKSCISMTAADGHEITIAELGKGDFFGEMAMLDGKPRSARATAVQPFPRGQAFARAFPFFRSRKFKCCAGNAGSFGASASAHRRNTAKPDYP